jgi:hypothetical protein
MKLPLFDWAARSRSKVTRDVERFASEVSRLKLEPGDIVVFRSKRCLSKEMIVGLKASAKLILPPDVKVMVLDDGMELSVVTPGPAA